MYYKSNIVVHTRNATIKSFASFPIKTPYLKIFHLKWFNHSESKDSKQTVTVKKMWLKYVLPFKLRSVNLVFVSFVWHTERLNFLLIKIDYYHFM